MDKVKKIMKEFSIFAICLACFCGLFLYRMAVKADISTISESKLVQKIEADESFVVYTSSSSSTTALTYQEVVEKYLTKNRSEKIYFLNLDELDDANTFVSTYFKKDAADLTKEYTYVNPGSVSIPKEGSWHGYILADSNGLVWKDFNFDIKKSLKF